MASKLIGVTVHVFQVVANIPAHDMTSPARESKNRHFPFGQDDFASQNEYPSSTRRDFPARVERETNANAKGIAIQHVGRLSRNVGVRLCRLCSEYEPGADV